MQAYDRDVITSPAMIKAQINRKRAAIASLAKTTPTVSRRGMYDLPTNTCQIKSPAVLPKIQLAAANPPRLPAKLFTQKAGDKGYFFVRKNLSQLLPTSARTSNISSIVRRWEFNVKKFVRQP